MKKRIAVVDREKCNPDRCGLECVKACPVNRTGAECITINEEKKKIASIDENLCTGCGICVKKCPFHAISIVNLPYEVGKPFHQYGKNSFRIYKFPLIRKGVIGIIGPNGIGKSTIIKILSGNLVPNLGDFEKPGSWDKVIEEFKGHEIQEYFELIASGNAKVSYKPQEIMLLPKVFKGNVEKLLEKTDERNKLDELSEKLEIKKCFDKTLSEVSGGELQRIAITASLLKEADFYFFDEPSSFLDIKQRLKTARVIKEELEGKAVFVVEHDLAVLDYLADYVHVLYGKPGVFGVVSGLKTARTGINEFLHGFLKNENVRIRDYEIKFEVKPPSSEWENKEIITYHAFKKKYKSFELEVKEGELIKGEVIGVMGPNAIGKSTFVKVLAGVEKPTEGDPELKLTTSYKPQYVEFEEDITVREFIESQKDFDFAFFNSEVKKTVEDLYDKKVKNLSGGEAQRLAIGIAISKTKDLILLDEPSAFLDIEQRFKLAQMIKRVTEKREVTTLNVDHDIAFQDLVSNRIMIFEGEPGKKGTALPPVGMHEGMNRFLKSMNVTFRRDPETGRPRMNKPGSQMDSEQKKKGEYYYVVS